MAKVETQDTSRRLRNKALPLLERFFVRCNQKGNKLFAKDAVNHGNAQTNHSSGAHHLS